MIAGLTLTTLSLTVRTTDGAVYIIPVQHIAGDVVLCLDGLPAALVAWLSGVSE